MSEHQSPEVQRAVGRALRLRELHIDCETRSLLNLKEVGVDRYMRHPSTRCLMISWAFDDEPAQQWVMGEPFPLELLQALNDPRVIKWAHNATFERAMFRYLYLTDSPIEQWRCTMALSFMLGLPGKLEDVGKVVKMPEEFAKAATAGKKLIRVFCSPRTGKKTRGTFFGPEDRPAEWEEFKEYNKQDVVAERFLLHKRLRKYEILNEEWESWFLDQKINERGCPADRQFVENAQGMVERVTERVLEQLHRLTDLANPNSDKQFGPWIRERGYPYGDLRKESVKKALDSGELSEIAEKALRLRSQLKRTSVKKYATILDALPDDDLLRFMFQFSGAKRTGRWSGRLVQLQNLAKIKKEWEKRVEDIVDAVKRNDLEYLEWMYGDVLTALSGVIRAALRAPEDHDFFVADYAAIEARVVAWLARCPAFLKVFQDGLDPYKAFGSRMYHKPYDEITKAERNNSKPPVLGAGFRLSGGEEVIDRKTGDLKKTGLWGYAENMGIKMTREEAHEAVRVFREMYPEVVQCWYDLENAAKRVIQNGGEEWVGYLRFDLEGPFLRMRLPSGRYLRYLRPKVELKTTPYGKEKWTVTYEGMEDNGESKFWGRIPTHGGKFMENAAQAIANDLLRFGMKNAFKAAFDIALHVHDEVVAIVKRGARNLKELIEAIIILPRWATNFPIDAAGFITPFYKKD